MQPGPNLVSESTMGHHDAAAAAFSWASTICTLPSTMLFLFVPVYIYRHFRIMVSSLAIFKTLFRLLLVGVLLYTELLTTSVRSRNMPETSQLIASCAYLAALCLVLTLYLEHGRPLYLNYILTGGLALHALLDVLAMRNSREDGKELRELCAMAAGQKLLLAGIEFLSPSNPANGNRQAGYGYQTKLWTHFLKFNKKLEIADLPKLKTTLLCHELHHQFSAIWSRVDKASSMCLFKAIFDLCPEHLICALLFRVCAAAATFAQPLVMRSMMEVAAKEQVTAEITARLFFLTVVVYGGISLSLLRFNHHITYAVTSIHGALLAQLLDKTLLLKYNSSKNMTAIDCIGKEMELIAKHVDLSIDQLGTIIDAIIGLGYLFYMIGGATWIALVPVLVSLVVMLSRNDRAGRLSEEQSAKRKQRSLYTERVLEQLKTIKIIGLGPKVSNKLQYLFSAETAARAAAMRHWVTSYVTGVSIQRTMPPLVLIGGILRSGLNSGMTPVAVFPVFTVAALLVEPLIRAPPEYSIFLKTINAINEVKDFLLQEEYVDARISSNSPASGTALEEKNTPQEVMSLSKLHVQRPNSDVFVLQNITCDIWKSHLHTVVGSTANGKSLLLLAILGELTSMQGTIELFSHGPIAYCSQVPWLQNGTIRSNITGPNIFNVQRYRRVIHACDLNRDFSELEDGDDTLVGSQGSRLSGGQKQRIALARALYTEASIMVFDEIFSSLDRITARKIFARLFGNEGILRRSKTTTILSTHSIEFLSEADHIFMIGPEGHLTVPETHFDLDLSHNSLAALNHSNEFATDERNRNEHSGSTVGRIDTGKIVRQDTDDESSDVLRTASNWNLACNALRLAPRHRVIILLILMLSLSTIMKFPEVYLFYWTDTALSGFNYLRWCAIAFVAEHCAHIIVYRWAALKVIPTMGANAHQALLDTTLSATIPDLASMEHGLLLNRFIEDLDTINKMAWWGFSFSARCMLTTVDLVLLSFEFKYAVLCLPVFAGIVYAIHRFYGSASQQLKRLNMASKSSVYSYLLEVTAGTPHIRAFGWQKSSLATGLTLLDQVQRTFFLLRSIKQWLSFAANLLVFGAALTLAFAVTACTNLPLSFVAIAMLILSKMETALVFAATHLIEFTTAIGAVERLQQYLDTTNTERLTGQLPPPDWPRGKLELHNVTAQYSPDKPVLDGINLMLEPGFRVGVVGRTGSGKSSLSLTVLNSIEFTGKILVDGIDVSTIAPQELRRRATVIAQETVELPGSLRENIVPSRDVHGEATKDFSDETLAKTLRQVGLWDYIQKHGGLDTLCSDLQFSRGQKQLLCVARALLQNMQTESRLVILDEISSDMDYDTGQKIHEVIYEALAGCTLLIVAHRVETLRNVDYLLELDKGAVVSCIPCSERAAKIQKE